MAVQTQIQTRRGTAATWTSTNPTLAAGEIGFETDTNKFKIGTGSTAWTALAYAANTSPLTTKGDLYTYSTTNDRLPVGNNGETLVADSSAATGLKWAAPATGMANPMTTTGDTIYSSPGSTPVRRAIGTTGQVLTVSGGLPVWATPSAAVMNWTQITSTSMSGVQQVVTNVSGYNFYLVQVVGANRSGADNPVGIRINGDTASNYRTAGWYVNLNQTISQYALAEGQFEIGGTLSPNSIDCVALITGGSGTNAVKQASWVSGTSSFGSNKARNGQGIYTGSGAISSITVGAYAGSNYSAGTLTIWGA